MPTARGIAMTAAWPCGCAARCQRRQQMSHTGGAAATLLSASSQSQRWLQLQLLGAATASQGPPAQLCGASCVAPATVRRTCPFLLHGPPLLLIAAAVSSLSLSACRAPTRRLACWASSSQRRQGGVGEAIRRAKFSSSRSSSAFWPLSAAADATRRLIRWKLKCAAWGLVSCGALRKGCSKTGAVLRPVATRAL
jgi:hypothetical protein